LPHLRPDTIHRGLKAFDMAALSLSAAFIGPLLLSILGGVPSVVRVLDQDFVAAFGTSFAIATAAAIIACVLAFSLATAARRHLLRARSPWFAAGYDLLPTLLLAVPPFALTAGLFLMM